MISRLVKLFVSVSFVGILLTGCAMKDVDYALLPDGIDILYQGKLAQSVKMDLGKAISSSYSDTLDVYSYEGFNLEVKVLDDAVAYRFRGNAPKASYLIEDGTNRWASFLRGGDYENFFPKTDSCSVGMWAYPLLAEYSEGVFGFIAEAGIERGMAASRLRTEDTSGLYTVDPASEQSNPVSPWRVVIVGDLKTIVESTAIVDLSPECTFEDTSWIEPGVSSWVYWAHNHGSKDFQIVKGYVDLAAKMGWPYCLVDWEWDEMSNGGDIYDVLAYAKPKNVKINLWYNSGTSWIGEGAPTPIDRLITAEAREKEMTWLNEVGVTGIKVDFFAGDSEEMMNYYIDILEDAARHHLLVDFHGCTVPRGWQKTYPNMMSMESVYGAEWYNNLPFLTDRAAAHNATLPFTRGLMGPMDYTPGTFSDTQHPHITTHAHELALPILFQSSLLHMPDSPESYATLPNEVIDLISNLPAAWDETRFIAGYPGEYAVLARRKGDFWYVAGINGKDEPMDIEVPGIEGSGIAFMDADEDRKFDIRKIESVPSSIHCRARGGFVLRISSKRVAKLSTMAVIPTLSGDLKIIPMSGSSVRVCLGEDADIPVLENLFYTESAPRVKFTLEETQSLVSVLQSGIRTDYSKDSGLLSFYDADGNLLLKEDSKKVRASKISGVKCLDVTDSFVSPEDEFLYGLGQFQDGYLNVRGLSRRLTQVNTQISIPMILSSRGYGILWNNYSMTEFNPCTSEVALSSVNVDSRAFTVNATGTAGNVAERRQYEVFAGEFEVMQDGEYAFLLDVGQAMARKHYLSIDGNTLTDCTNLWLPPTTSLIAHLTKGKHTVEVRGVRGDSPVLHYKEVDSRTTFHSPVSTSLDYTVFAGSADEVVSSYRNLTGKVPSIPSWALGYVHCRERFVSQSDLLENAREFHSRGIPVDVMVQDWQWWGSTGWNSLEFDKSLYPDPKAMVQELDSLGMKLMLSVWSKVDTSSSFGKKLSQKNYYIEGTDWIDFFDPEAAQYYVRSFRDSLVTPYGIQAWWFDATEPENDDLAGRKVGKDNLPGEFYRNVYPLKVIQTMYNGLKENDPKNEPLILTRSMAPGIQRYGAVTWSGDVGNDYETLRRQIVGGLSLNACGIPWWTYDAGGFFRPGDQYTSEDYQRRMLRWIQNSVFLPIMRVHGYMSQTEPWRYPEEIQDIYVQAIERRYELLDYIKECAKKVSSENYTLMRPLVFDFASDREALCQDTEFMFGPKYLVCPVTKEMEGTMRVYLPKNEGGWKDCRTSSEYKGGQYVEVPLTEDQIPYFERL